MKQYTPRRASKRWLANAPAHILDCFKNKCGTYDVLYTGPLLCWSPSDGPRTFANCYIMGREMDSQPQHPQGVGMSFELKAHEAASYRYRNGKCRIKWDDLPEAVRHCAELDGKL